MFPHCCHIFLTGQFHRIFATCWLTLFLLFTLFSFVHFFLVNFFLFLGGEQSLSPSNIIEHVKASLAFLRIWRVLKEGPVPPRNEPSAYPCNICLTIIISHISSTAFSQANRCVRFCVIQEEWMTSARLDCGKNFRLKARKMCFFLDDHQSNHAFKGFLFSFFSMNFTASSQPFSNWMVVSDRSNFRERDLS